MDIRAENALIAKSKDTATPAEELRKLWDGRRDYETELREGVFKGLLYNDSTPSDLLLSVGDSMLPHHEDLATRLLTHPNATPAIWELVFRKAGFSRNIKRQAYRLLKENY